jgi:hypothetical protein
MLGDATKTTNGCATIYPGAPIIRETDRYRSYSARFVEIAEQVRGHNAMFVPHVHAGGLMTYYDPELVRIVEAFSAHHFDLNQGGFQRSRAGRTGRFPGPGSDLEEIEEEQDVRAGSRRHRSAQISLCR